jgi:hypothetical protein
MKKLGILASFLALFLFVVACSPKTQSNGNNNNNQNETETAQIEQTPLAVLKENQKIMKTIKGYKYSRQTKENADGQAYDNTETGEEQINPAVSHFTTTKGIEYYYEKQTIYKKENDQWIKYANPDGKVLVSVTFINLVDQLLKQLGTKDELPGITVSKSSNEYVVTINYLEYKNPEMSDTDFTQFKKEMKKATTELTIDASTFEPKKYYLTAESTDGKTRSVDMTLSTYNTPVTTPADIVSSAKSAQ